MENTESQQKNRRQKEEPNGNIGTKKYNNQNNQMYEHKRRMEVTEERITELEIV